MGLARELTEGPKRPRKHSGTDPDIAALRRLSRAAKPDVDTFRETLERVTASARRQRFADGAILAVALERYAAITGTAFTPSTGVVHSVENP